MAQYSCFFCQSSETIGSSLTEACPGCSRPYGLPLTSPPQSINDHKILAPLGRGFYAVTYVCETGRLKTRYVLKVAPKAIYKLYSKVFDRECLEHKRLADGTEHLVHIEDMFDATVALDGKLIDCHVAKLQYISGRPLDEVIASRLPLPARTIAQIAIDLFQILEEFSGRAFHNDLHGGNIIIQSGLRRADAVDPAIRAVAIDLGSVSDLSRSDSTQQRIGDIHWVATHLSRLVDSLLRNPDGVSDLDYRLASALEDIAHRLTPSAEMQRMPGMLEFADQIRAACQHVVSPWREPLILKKFNDSYNAQALAPWYVPLLIVDPDERWLRHMSTRGPQIITGMRGCGKTLFLRALQFHARAARRDREDATHIIRRLQNDRFVGLYASTNRLLDTLGVVSEKLHEPYTRLYLAYALEAVRALDHLSEIDRNSTEASYPRILSKSIADLLSGETSDLRDATLPQHLHNWLLHALISLSRGETRYQLKANPAVAFPHLAEDIQKCSHIFGSAYILFLLDDVSTRYLSDTKIHELLSSLLFQSPSCAFKITSEAQTLQMQLKSPGQIELARSGRDYEVFDLGAEVYNRITKRHPATGSDRLFGKAFVEQILHRRAHYYSGHPTGIPPHRILGDTTLESIAHSIASTNRTSRRKKQAYWGLTALARVCVGDIGDVISLYELILQKAEGRKYPVPKSIQSESFQQFCSRRLYDLNRRRGDLKDIALSFAKSSHELLVKSYHDNRQGHTKRQRLRQYMSIYVRITAGNTRWQYSRLREIIDAGVFVFAGGSDAPRTKTRDSNPIQHFKLTYRKIYGLSDFIGLAEGDRFELSGEQLEQWLTDTDHGKDILLRNVGSLGDTADIENEPDAHMATSVSQRIRPASSRDKQRDLFAEAKAIGPLFAPHSDDLDDSTKAWLKHHVPRVRELTSVELQTIPTDILVTGLGFEDRALVSTQRLCACVKPKSAILVQYNEVGLSKEIIAQVESTGTEISLLDYGDINNLCFDRDIRVLVDVSGLAKPALFRAVRQAMKASSRIQICHTKAQQYYPLEADIAGVLQAEKKRDHYTLLPSLAKILTGEQSPYSSERLDSSESDSTRRHALIAFASPKHERLLTLLDNRQYNSLDIIAPTSVSQRGRLAKIAADVAMHSFGNGSITEIDANDLAGLLTFLLERYQYWYVNRGFNVDLALTGSKIQGIACAVLASIVKIANCIYVSPREFDFGRFTKGVSTTSFLEITAGENNSGTR